MHSRTLRLADEKLSARPPHTTTQPNTTPRRPTPSRSSRSSTCRTRCGRPRRRSTRSAVGAGRVHAAGRPAGARPAGAPAAAVLLRRYLPGWARRSRGSEAVKAGSGARGRARRAAAKPRRGRPPRRRVRVDGNCPSSRSSATAASPRREAAITIVAHMAPALVEPDAGAARRPAHQHAGGGARQPRPAGGAGAALSALATPFATPPRRARRTREGRGARRRRWWMAHVLGKMLGVLEGAVNAGEAGRMLGVVQDISMWSARRAFKMLPPRCSRAWRRRDVAARRRRPRRVRRAADELAEGALKMRPSCRSTAAACSRCSCR